VRDVNEIRGINTVAQLEEATVLMDKRLQFAAR